MTLEDFLVDQITSWKQGAPAVYQGAKMPDEAITYNVSVGPLDTIDAEWENYVFDRNIPIEGVVVQVMGTLTDIIGADTVKRLVSVIVAVNTARPIQCIGMYQREGTVVGGIVCAFTDSPRDGFTLSAVK